MKQQIANKIGILVLAVVGVVLCTSAIAYVVKTKYIPPVVSGDTAPDNEQSAPLEKDIVRVLVTGIDDTGMLTDVIMVGMFDVKNNRASVLQIPRDSFVGNIYPTGKINSVYGHPIIYEKDDGMKELEAVIEQQFKLPIDYYASISLSSFREIINSMGGVEMNVPFTIEYLPGKVIYQGEQTLNGEHAEWLVRYRKGYATGDIGRVNVQTEFLKALITSVKQKGRINAVNLLAKNYSEITTNLPLNKMIAYANEAYTINTEDISFFVAEGSGAMNKSYAVYQLDAAKLAECLNTNFRPLGEFVSEQELEIQQVPLPPPIQEEYNTEQDAEENFFSEDEYIEQYSLDTETDEQESLWFDELFK